jgi:hypothetical protein
MKRRTAGRSASLMYWSGVQRLLAIAVPVALLWGAVAWAVGGAA